MLLGTNWSLKQWFKLRDRLRQEKAVRSMSWGYSEGGEMSRKFDPSFSFLMIFFFFFSWHSLAFPCPFGSLLFANHGARTVAFTWNFCVGVRRGVKAAVRLAVRLVYMVVAAHWLHRVCHLLCLNSFCDIESEAELGRAYGMAATALVLPD